MRHMSEQTTNIPTGYKLSPLGIIPEDWEVKRLGEVCDIDKNSLSSNTNPNYEFDYISLSDVDSESFEITTTRQVFKTAPSRARRIVSKGDVIISTVRPNLQAFTLIKDEVIDLIVSTGFAVLTPQKINGEYLYHYVFSQPITKQFYQLVVGSNYPAVNSSDVFHLKIAVPPLLEQQRIVSVLSLWDTAIAKQTALIEKLTLRKRGLMQQLLTGKKRLKGFEGEWKEVRLGDIAQITMGQSPDSRFYNERGEGLPLIQGNADIKDRKSIQRIWTSSVTKACECNDIIMSVRAPVGEIAIATQKSCIGRGVCSITSTNVDAEYLFQLLLLLEDSWGNIEQGGTFTSINSQEIQKKKVFIPKQSEQIAIATILTLADKEIETQKQKLAAMQEQKKGLMQILLTGKRRVTI